MITECKGDASAKSLVISYKHHFWANQFLFANFFQVMSQNWPWICSNFSKNSIFPLTFDCLKPCNSSSMRIELIIMHCLFVSFWNGQVLWKFSPKMTWNIAYMSTLIFLLNIILLSWPKASNILWVNLFIHTKMLEMMYAFWN